MPVDLAREVLQAIGDPSRDAYRYRRLNFFLHRPYEAGGWQLWNSIHLARRHVLRFRGLWHEEVLVNCGPERVGQLRSQMWHLNDDSYVERLRKNINMARVEAKLIVESNRIVKWYHFLLHPARAAFMAYVVQRGFTAGTLGLLQAVYTFSGTFNRYAWAWDVQNRISRQVLEDEFSRGWESASSESLLKRQ